MDGAIRVSRDPVEAIARTLLYEGYLLYPYGPSSLKNRYPWAPGGLYPEVWCDGGADSWWMRAEGLVRGNPTTRLEVSVRFLRRVARSLGALSPPLRHLPAIGEPAFRLVESIAVGSERLHAWEEGVEQAIPLPETSIGELEAAPVRVEIRCQAERTLEPIREPDGSIPAIVLREARALEGSIDASVVRLREDLFRWSVRVENRTPYDVVRNGSHRQESREAGLRAFCSAHAVVRVHGGELVSLLEPPDAEQAAVATCENVGVFPVLVGEPGRCDRMLCSPVLLYDYPRIAPESAGDLFDATEIDEILTLRIRALTEEEKREMTSADPRARAILDRAEALTDSELLALHGADRAAPAGPRARRAVRRDGVTLLAGDRVRLLPEHGGDVFDLALRGRTAVIESIEEDFDDRTFVVVTVDDDPGRDLGSEGKPGHRFFFRPEEVEPLETEMAR